MRAPSPFRRASVGISSLQKWPSSTDNGPQERGPRTPSEIVPFNQDVPCVVTARADDVLGLADWELSGVSHAMNHDKP